MTGLQHWSTSLNAYPSLDLDQQSTKLDALFKQALQYKSVLETLLSITDDFVYIKDAQHKFMFASDAFARLTGHEQWRELQGKDDFDIFPKEHAELYFEHEQDVINKGISLAQHEEPYYLPSGELGWVSSTKNPVFDDTGKVIGLIGISKDITQIKRHQELIAHQATHDCLTDVYNRKAFYDFGETMWAKLQRDKTESTLLFMDLNEFKQVNDRLGHQVGDKILCRFASFLKEECRDSDLLARLGGDEFVIYMGGDKDAALSLARRLISASHKEELLGCAISIGIAHSSNAENLAELVKHADEAMYKAKRSKSQQYCFYPFLRA